MFVLGLGQQAVGLTVNQKLGTDAQPKLAKGVRSFEPEHTHFKLQHQSSQQYALHMLIECLMSVVHAVFLKYV